MAKVLGMVQHDITLVTRRPKRKKRVPNKPKGVAAAGFKNRSAKYRGEPLTHSPFADALKNGAYQQANHLVR